MKPPARSRKTSLRDADAWIARSALVFDPIKPVKKYDFDPLEVIPETDRDDPRKIYSWHVQRLFGLVRSLREEAQSIRRYVDDVLAKEELADAESRALETRAAIGRAAQAFAYNFSTIQARLGAITTVLERNASVLSEYGDIATRIENAWDRTVSEWVGSKAAAGIPSGTLTDKDRLDLTERIGKFKRVRSALGELIFEAAFLTIPPRANENLKAVPIGRGMDFTTVFEDELPDPDQRKKILKFMSDYSVGLRGVVDVDKGMIVRASRNWRRRAVSWFIPGVLFLIGLAAATQAGPVLASLGVEHATGNGPTVAYILLFAGAILHVLIDALKEARSSEGSQYKAIEDVGLWLHLKEMQFIFAVLWLWVGYLGLTTVLKTIDPVTAFIAGYSVDSVADLFVSRFETKVGTFKKEVEAKKEAAVQG